MSKGDSLRARKTLRLECLALAKAATYGAARAPLALLLVFTGWGVGVGAWGLLWFKANFLH